MANRNISYTTRDYQGIRTELLNYVRTYYPELIQDFNDASVFSVFLDLNAAVADSSVIRTFIYCTSCVYAIILLYIIIRDEIKKDV